MSGTESPITSAESLAGTMQPVSTLASYPVTNPDHDNANVEKAVNEHSNGHEDVAPGHDLEEVDSKTKALMHLLKTSSVSCSLNPQPLTPRARLLTQLPPQRFLLRSCQRR